MSAECANNEQRTQGFFILEALKHLGCGMRLMPESPHRLFNAGNDINLGRGKAGYKACLASSSLLGLRCVTGIR